MQGMNDTSDQVSDTSAPSLSPSGLTFMKQSASASALATSRCSTALSFDQGLPTASSALATAVNAGFTRLRCWGCKSGRPVFRQCNRHTSCVKVNQQTLGPPRPGVAVVAHCLYLAQAMKGLQKQRFCLWPYLCSKPARHSCERPAHHPASEMTTPPHPPPQGFHDEPSLLGNSAQRRCHCCNYWGAEQPLGQIEG